MVVGVELTPKQACGQWQTFLISLSIISFVIHSKTAFWKTVWNYLDFNRVQIFFYSEYKFDLCVCQMQLIDDHKSSVANCIVRLRVKCHFGNFISIPADPHSTGPLRHHGTGLHWIANDPMKIQTRAPIAPTYEPIAIIMIDYRLPREYRSIFNVKLLLALDLNYPAQSWSEDNWHWQPILSINQHRCVCVGNHPKNIKQKQID